MDKENKIDTSRDGNSIPRTDMTHTKKKVGSSRDRRPQRRKMLSLSNSRLARSIWGLLPSVALKSLQRLTESYGLSVAAGDLQFLDGRWYVTHSGLLRIAERRHCAGIGTELLRDLSDSSLGHWVFKAVVYKSASQGIRRLRRCRSLQRFFHGAWGRVAHCRNSRRQPRAPQSLWHRPLLGRRVRCVLERAATLHCFIAVQRTFVQWKWQRPAPAARSALSFNPPVQPRCQSGKGLRSGLLRHRHP